MIFEKLNDEQKNVVMARGNLLLKACPGSGKTRVIIHKIVHEINMLGEHSRRKIAAVTFTMRAAEEIVRRLSTYDINKDRVWAGTLHSFCIEWILKPYSFLIDDLKNGFSIADENYCLTVLNNLKEKYGLDSFLSISTKLDVNGRYIQSNVPLKLFNEYETILKKDKYIDFDRVIYLSVNLLNNNPQIGLIISKIFSRICVDEYQDTQDLLYVLINKIVKAGNGNTNIMYVGDPDQSIYGSLGGKAKDLNELKCEISPLEIGELSIVGNYRSSQKIIDFFSLFQSTKRSIQAIGNNSLINNSIISYSNNIHFNMVSQEVARLVKFNLSLGIPENEICILVPQWSMIRNIRIELKELLPSVGFDSENLSESSILRNNIWFKITRLILVKPSPKIYNSRIRWAKEVIDLLVDQTEGNLDDYFLKPRNILHTINSIECDELNVIPFINHCFDRFLEKINIDITFFSELDKNKKNYLSQLHQNYKDKPISYLCDIYKEKTGIVISSCAGAKGEEFETVIVFGLLEGYIPHWQEIFSQNGQEASKKMLYVIASRAKRNLHLISEKGRLTQRGSPYLPTNALLNLPHTFDLC